MLEKYTTRRELEKYATWKIAFSVRGQIMFAGLYVTESTVPGSHRLIIYTLYTKFSDGGGGGL